MGYVDLVAELSRRVNRLDIGAGDSWHLRRPMSSFERFLTVMDEITDTSAVSGSSSVPPSVADAIASRSTLLSRLSEIAPEIVVGPLDPDEQFWIGTGKPSTVPKSDPWLSYERFVDARDVADQDPSTKPFWTGLYTATGLAGTFGMWELYLEATQSTLFPKPWHIWKVQPIPEARIREVQSAASWADFVCSYPRQRRGLVYPNWRSVARDYDAVHVTLGAVAALQGVHLKVEDNILAPCYWGLESTLWLHWCFGAVQLVAVREHR